jgi:hypothetical protein
VAEGIIIFDIYSMKGTKKKFDKNENWIVGKLQKDPAYFPQ